MRTIYVNLFVLGLLSFPLNSSCQSPDSAPFSSAIHELNLGSGSMGHEFFLGYKHNFAMGALRTGTDLNLFWSNYSNGVTEDKTLIFGIDPRIGYEFYQWYGRFRLHYGADLGYSFNSYRTKSLDGGDEFNILIDNSHGVNLSPLIGISVFLSPSFSLTMESCVNVRYFILQNGVDEENPTLTGKGIYVGLKPLGLLSLNYHF